MEDILVMKNIVKKYGQGHTEVTALKGVDFTVKAGEFVSIIGPSGSGKSTFLTIAGGLSSATSGEIHISDINFTKLNEKERSKLRFKEIGFILQSSNLIPYLTVEEQLFLVDKIEKRKKNTAFAKELLEALNILDLKDKYPSDLSGGERQRAAIARALFNQPNLILADEPTASLDSEHAFEVVKLLAKEAHEENKAMVMVTHDIRMTEWSDKVYTMEDGILTRSR
jgi:putative ABC transport system ATP-binding protein